MGCFEALESHHKKPAVFCECMLFMNGDCLSGWNCKLTRLEEQGQDTDSGERLAGSQTKARYRY